MGAFEYASIGVGLPWPEAKHEAQDLLIYPNPAGSVVNISLSSECRIPSSGCRVKLFDISGKLMMQFNYDGSEQINVTILQPGIYFLEARTENGVVKGKFIKR
jgi:hypothetical protein